MYGFCGSALGFAAARWQWQPTPHDPSNIIELSDAAGGSAQTLTGTLFSDSDSFGAGVVSTSITLTGTLFSDGDSFGAGTISTAITITGTLFSDGDSFGAGTVSQAGGSQTLTGTLFDDSADSFGSGVISTSITISGALYDDADTFGAGTISQVSPQTITGTLFVDDDSFGAGEITVQSVTTNRGDDAAVYRLTGEARKAIYERQLKSLEDELETAPRPAKRKEKARKLKELVIAAAEPVFEPLRDEIPPLIEQYSAHEIDWDTLSAAIEEQIAAIRRARRKRRNRNIALAMLMAA